MIVRWSARASKDIDNIQTHLESEAGVRVALDQILKIYAAVDHVRNFPFAGRAADSARGRILPIQGTPYVLLYEVVGDAVRIASIRHGAQRPLVRFPRS